MLDPTSRLRHLPFFEAVAARDENTLEWRAATAGLVVLRFVDAWLEEGERGDVARLSWSLAAVRQAVDEAESPANLKPILHGIVDAMATGRSGLRLVGPRLMAYAQILEYESQWPLATDVYESIVLHAHPVDEADLATQAHLRIGFCLRQLGQLTDSVRAYQTASAIAAQANDLVGVLRARIGEAKAMISRGEMPEANAILEDTVTRARAGKIPDVESMALHDRSMVAYLSGQYDLAVRLAYEALESSKSPRERDRILGDIATSFRKLGLRSAAHDAYVILAATAQEQYGRWSATLNLMDMASEEGQQVVFEQYRRSLSPALLPLPLQVEYWQISGTAHWRFGETDESRASLQRALAIAQEHGLDHAASVVQATMTDLARQPAARYTPAAPAAASAEAEDVAQRLRAVRLELEV